MKPTPRQRALIRKALPRDWKIHHIHLRAYCIAKPAVGCAVFVVPGCDGVTGSQFDTAHDVRGVPMSKPKFDVYDFKVGDWATLVYVSPGSWGAWAAMQPIDAVHRQGTPNG